MPNPIYILEKLRKLDSYKEKLSILNKVSYINEALKAFPYLQKNIPNFSDKDFYLIKSLFFIKQGAIIFRCQNPESESSKSKFQTLLSQLSEIETFYNSIGGIIGYHQVMREMLHLDSQPPPLDPKENLRFLQAQGVDISKDSLEMRQGILNGIYSLPKIAEIYVIGGAGDRLGLIDEQSGEALPVAKLAFLGNSLLEHLIHDLQAREYLYYKLHSKQLCTPIAMMTSYEKHNHQHITSICASKSYFHRPKSHFLFFTQPGAAVLTTEGHWSMKDELELTLKPGGHGVIWKLAKDKGIYKKLYALNRYKVLLRQINNPIASIDNGLLSFTGLSLSGNFDFAFASCQRKVGASEGTLVLKESTIKGKRQSCLTNIEYTSFDHYNIKDTPYSPKSPYSKFPANINLLFADLKLMETLSKKHPLPGILVNIKNTCSFINAEGQKKELPAARLETTMQNIADYIYGEESRCFLSLNKRHKTISVTKKHYIPGGPAEETPESAYFDVLKNAHEMLSQYCQFKMPKLLTLLDSVEKHPPFIALYHPALGPLYSVIAQKCRGGRLAKGAELQLHIAECSIKNLDINGSLIVEAKSPMGKLNTKKYLEYSEHSGKCLLENVTIENAGIDYSAKNIYWKNHIQRKELLKIVIEGNGEFEARNLRFVGNHHIQVPSGKKITAYQDGNHVRFKEKIITEPSWFWKYTIDHEQRILLSSK